MSLNGTTGWWALITLFSSVCAGLLALVLAHEAAPKHAEAANETDVTNLAVKLERVSTDLDNNKRVLVEVKEDVAAIRTEQRESTQEILRAIRSR